MAQTKLIFEELAKKSENCRIDSITISKLIVEWVYGVDAKESSKCGGPIMNFWRKKGLLTRIRKKGNAVIFEISEEAISEFDLKLNKAEESVQPQSSDIKVCSGGDVLSVGKRIAELAPKIREAQKRIPILKEQKKSISDELMTLKAFLETPECKAVMSVLKDVQAMTGK